jgi:hypothetical protein
MAPISYREYAWDLQGRIRKLHNADDVDGAIDIAIFRNARCYRSFELVGVFPHRKFATGPFDIEGQLTPEDGRETCREIDQFFSLPEVFAYSDQALQAERNPLKRSHWDGTLALVEVRYSTPVTRWHQRMLFIAFRDPIHADFSLALDQDILMHGDSEGQRLFEWRSDSSERSGVGSSCNQPVSDCSVSEQFQLTGSELSPKCKQCLALASASRISPKCSTTSHTGRGAAVSSLTLSLSPATLGVSNTSGSF